MKLNTTVISMLGASAGCDVTTPAGAMKLQLDIHARTGELLSVNTVKRLTGVIDYAGEPRVTTLDIVARYLGHDSWQTLAAVVNNRVSRFGGDSPFVDAAALPADSRMELAWEPGRRVVARHLGRGLYRVESVTAAKLAAGDLMRLSQLAPGFPLVASSVVRDGADLGVYTAADELGLTLVDVLP